MRGRSILNGQQESGFTLIELVVVLVILGILAMFAVPRFFDSTAFLQRGYYEELATALKYSQKLAVASGCPVRVTIAAGNYQARQQAVQSGSCDLTDTTWPTAIQLADGQMLAGTSPGGVTAAPAVTVTFDARATWAAPPRRRSPSSFASRRQRGQAATGQATFGIFGGESRQIYTRELY